MFSRHPGDRRRGYVETFVAACQVLGERNRDPVEAYVEHVLEALEVGELDEVRTPTAAQARKSPCPTW